MVDHSRPTAAQYREAFTPRNGEATSATQALAVWLLHFSEMFDYDNASSGDAMIIAQELLGTKPRELHKVRHASKPQTLRR